MTYQLKQIPEDFIVKEISDVKVKEQGRFLYFKLKKKNRNTLDVVKELARQLHLKERQIGFAGSKDKQAVTEQVISVLGVKKDKILNTNVDQVQLEFLGQGNKPISLGDLEGNEFKIVVRNLDDVKINKTKFIPNYFDEQRFSKHNAKVGEHLIKKQFQKAVALIDSERCQAHLKEHRNDYIGALKKIPLRLLRMYVNAYQSYFWNETVAEYLRKKGEVVKEVKYSLGKFLFVKEKKGLLKLTIPLVGFGSEELESEEVKEIINKVIEKEQIIYHDFIIKQIPELSLEGELRKVFVEIKDLKTGKEEPDELNKGKKKIKLTFSLPKGSYATMVVKALVEQ